MRSENTLKKRAPKVRIQIIPCKQCGIDFKPSQNGVVYCSKSCFNETRRNYENAHWKSQSCSQCGLSFIPTKGAKGNHCSLKCWHKSQIKTKIEDYPDHYKCTKCLASVGFGVGVASRLASIDKSMVAKAWRNCGIVAKKPECGSWRVYVSKPNQSRSSWWGGDESASQWMSEYKPKFPDWGYLWKKPIIPSYHRLTAEEKAERNKKSWERRKLLGTHIKDRIKIKEWRQKNKEKVNASIRKSIKKRKIIDPGFRVQCNLRHRLKDLMKTTKKGGAHHVSALIGCSTKQLAKHLESQFRKGMSWDNYGIDGWHVDHILPCATFDHNDPKQVAQCWHWTNLRPLWAKENMNKSDTITEPQMNLLFGGMH